MWTGLQAESNFMNKPSEYCEYGEDEQRENDNMFIYAALISFLIQRWRFIRCLKGCL